MLKVLRRERSFVLRSHTMAEYLNSEIFWFVAHAKFKTYWCMGTEEAKNGNKNNIKQYPPG